MPNPTDLPSVAVAIRPEECLQRIPGDLDGDCQLDAYEICMLGGHGHDVSECVESGSNLEVCIEDDERNRRCNQLDQIANNGNWSTRMQELRTATTGNTEILYYGNIGNDGNMDYSSGDRIEREPNEHGIPNHTIQNPADSATHNHFVGALPVFSLGDLYSLWTWYHNNLINDTGTFIMYVTTTGNSNATTNDDTLYALTISDVQKFQEKGALFLSNEDALSGLFLQKYNINQNILVILNEQRFLNLIDNLDLGLALYKGNTNDFDDWAQLKLRNDGSVNEKNCN